MRKYPYEGAWQVILTSSNDPTHPAEFNVVLTYSADGGRYWGYSNLISTVQDSKGPEWVEVTDFVPEGKAIQCRVHYTDGTQRVYEWPLMVSHKGRLLKSQQPKSDLSVELRRPI